MVQRAQRQGSSLSSSSPHHCQVRPQSEITIHGVLKGECQESRVTLSRPHVAQVKKLSGSWLQHSFRTQIIISLTLRHISKIVKGHDLIWPSHCFTPSQGFWVLLSCRCHRQDLLWYLTLLTYFVTYFNVFGASGLLGGLLLLNTGPFKFNTVTDFDKSLS